MPVREGAEEVNKQKFSNPFAKTPGIAFLLNCKIYKLLRIQYLLKNIVNYEILFATMESNPFDLILL